MVWYLLIFAGKPDKDKLCHNDDGCHEQQRGQADGGEPRPGHERPHARLRRCLKDQLDGEHPSIHPSKHSSTHPSIQVGSLRCTYPGLTSDCMASIMDQIQRSIRQKDDEMSWLDKSCLQLAVRRKDKTETLTFQVGASMLVGKESFDVDVADALPGCEAGLGGRAEIGKTSSWSKQLTRLGYSWAGKTLHTWC